MKRHLSKISIIVLLLSICIPHFVIAEQYPPLINLDENLETILVDHNQPNDDQFVAPSDNIESEHSQWIVRWLETPLESNEIITVIDQDLEFGVAKIEISSDHPEDYIATLLADPNIAYIEPNITYSIKQAFNDPQIGEQYYLNHIGIPTAWGIVTPNSKLTVAIVDTGIDLEHPDLIDNLVPGVNLLDSKKPPQDDNGHGTTVAGVVGAVGNNQEGVTGILWKTRLLPIKVMGKDGDGDAYNVARGIRIAVNQGADIILLSVGDPIYSKFMKEAVEYADSKGVIVVAATGNKGEQVEYPAAFPTVLAVGAVDERDRVQSYSNYGPEVDVVAPGRNILTTKLGGGYTQASGTSLSAPQVAGLAGLILSKYPDFTPAQVRNLIRYSSKDISKKGWSEYSGYGRIDAERALTIPLVSNIHGPNHTSNNAAIFPLGKRIDASLKNQNDEGWFLLDIPYDGNLSIRLLDVFDSYGIQFKMTLFDRKLKSIKTQLGNDTLVLSQTLKKGEYLLKLEINESPEDLTETLYSLESSFTIYADSYEPNNTKETASVVPVKQDRIVGTLHKENDEDWYLFKLPADGKFTFRLSTDSLRLDPIVFVVKPDQTVHKFDRGNWENNQVEEGTFQVTAGNLYIMIKNYYDAAVNAEYFLRWTYEPLLVDKNEPNNTILTATSINLGDSIYAHIGAISDYDWYRFTVSKEGLIQIDGADFPLHITARMALYDEKYKRIHLINISRSQTSFITQQWLTKGNYFIRIDADSSFTDQFYQLKVTAIDAAYKDIGSSWARESINRMAEKGVIKGYADKTFKPDKQITRSEFVSLMVDILGINKSTKIARSPFSDVKSSHWAYTSIVGAYRSGFLTGYEDGTFRPDAPISRAEMATLLVKGLKLKPAHNSNRIKADSKLAVNKFTDIYDQYWATPSISFLVQLGLINGYQDNSFRPEQRTTRAEVAVLLERIWFSK